MTFVSENTNNTNITRYYSIGQISSKFEALAWIKRVSEIDEIDVNYIYFEDVTNRSEDGSDSVQIDPGLALENMKSILNDRDVDYIFLNATFGGKPIIVGVDLNEKLAYVTIRKKTPADFGTIEQRLNLVKDSTSSNNAYSLWMKIQRGVLGGVKVPHSTSQPVIYKEDGKYYLAAFTFLFSKEDIEAGMVARPTVWTIADIITGEIIKEYETKEKDFSDAPYDVKYNVRADGQYDTSKAYYDKTFAILDSVRDKLIKTGKLYMLEYQAYLDRIIANIPREYQRFYRDLSV